jgi:hypothetical protein
MNRIDLLVMLVPMICLFSISLRNQLSTDVNSSKLFHLYLSLFAVMLVAFITNSLYRNSFAIITGLVVSGSICAFFGMSAIKRFSMHGIFIGGFMGLLTYFFFAVSIVESNYQPATSFFQVMIIGITLSFLMSYAVRSGMRTAKNSYYSVEKGNAVT